MIAIWAIGQVLLGARNGIQSARSGASPSCMPTEGESGPVTALDVQKPRLPLSNERGLVSGKLRAVFCSRPNEDSDFIIRLQEPLKSHEGIL